HRVLGSEAPDVHDGRLRRGRPGLGAGDDALLRRLAGPVPRARRLPPPRRRDARAALARGGHPSGDVVHVEARLLHLAPDRHPLDAAALPLRPADAPRLAGAAAAVARQRRRLRAGDRALRRADVVSLVFFLVLAALTVAAALAVILHPNPVHSACALV